MNKAWYALRRTILPMRFELLVDELIEKLPQLGVDELIAKIDVEEFTHGQPNFEWVNKYCDKLKTVKSRLESESIIFSINPWITVGHTDRGRDGSVNVPDLQTMVGHDGTQCTCCACHLSPAWREHIRRVWKLYAELHPSVIWVEDDFRTWNHLPVQFSCFCDLHLAKFSKLVGMTVTREELVDAITQPGHPHPWRKIFLDMQRQVVLETVKLLVETVHVISPETSFGLMSSGPRIHCLEGRDWKSLAQEMSCGPQLISRPPLGSYCENSLRGLYYSADSIKLTRHVLPKGTLEQTEVENVPFSQYSKSVNFTFLQMAVSFALGCDGVTMNLFDHMGSPMSEQPEMLGMLAGEKQYLNSLAEAAQGNGSQRGIQLLFSPEHAYHKNLRKVDGYDLASDDYCLSETLESLGLPTTYSDEKVRASIGQTLRCFSDGEIKKILSDGLFIDAVAASVLVERGFGEYIGLDEIASPVNIDRIEPLAAEEFHNADFNGAEGKMLTLIMPDLCSRPSYSHAKISKKAQVISHMVDSDGGRKYPCMFAFENSFGGRVVVHLFDWVTACGTAFCSPYRRQKLQSALRWLGKDSLPAVVLENIYPLLIRRDLIGYTLLAVFNLTLDDYKSAVIEINESRKLKSIQILSDEGQWYTSNDLEVGEYKNSYLLKWNRVLNFRRPLIIKMDFDQSKKI